MSAVISACSQYRYWLERDRGDNPLVFIMLNPSTADAELDDPTIRRCRRFAADNGYTGIIVVNLYAYRATDPNDMRQAQNPIGEDNDLYIAKAARAGTVCCAWGANADKLRAQDVVEAVVAAGGTPLCLGVTKGGFPRHPLYVKSTQKLIPH